MNIDWDDLAQDADDSPRSILAEVLARADEWSDCVIIVHGHDGEIRHWTSAGSTAMALGMLAAMQHYMVHDMKAYRHND